jgi:solute carrier family 35 (UDP-sugar transporter), member A1/2/3
MFATYLYSVQDRRRPPPIRIASYEKTTIGGDPSYFDAPAPVFPKTPKSPSLGVKKDTGRSTSRPGTPTIERHHFRVSSGRRDFQKRED